MIHIDPTACTVCGTCAAVCPRHIPEVVEREGEKEIRIAAEREVMCMACGHCMAACPEDAVRVDGLHTERFAPISPLEVTERGLLTLMEQRRSVRRYRKKPVPRDLIDRIVEASRRAPTGTASRSTGILVIDRPEHLEALSGLIHNMYRGLDKALANPIGRFIIKRRGGERMLRTLQDFVMPGMRWYLRWKAEGRGDEILRDCPALMLFHSPVFEPMGEANCTIAAFHAIFMAQILGVGTCFNDLIPPACNRSPGIQDLLGLAAGREVYASLTLGFPRYPFRKTIFRDLAEVRYLDEGPDRTATARPGG